MDFYTKAGSRTLPVLGDLLIAFLVVLCAAILLLGLGCSKLSDEEITAEAERAAYDKKITFTLPIEYTATVTQCNPKCVTRYYYARSK